MIIVLAWRCLLCIQGNVFAWQCVYFLSVTCKLNAKLAIVPYNAIYDNCACMEGFAVQMVLLDFTDQFLATMVVQIQEIMFVIALSYLALMCS